MTGSLQKYCIVAILYVVFTSSRVSFCRTCQDVLTKCDTQLSCEHSYAHRREDLFAHNKQYSSSASVGLVLPRHELFSQMHKIEEQFRIFSTISATADVAKQLYDAVYPTLDFTFLFVEHPEHGLYLSLKITKLYIVMSLFYAIKFINRDINLSKVTGKRHIAHVSVQLRKIQKVLHK